jgi:hypothetical protein
MEVRSTAAHLEQLRAHIARTCSSPLSEAALIARTNGGSRTWSSALTAALSGAVSATPNCATFLRRKTSNSGRASALSDVVRMLGPDGNT